MENIRSIIRDWWVPIGIGFVMIGLTAQSITGHYRERKNLYDEVSKLARTNEERMQFYNKIGREVPLSDLTTQEMRSCLSSHQRESN